MQNTLSNLARLIMASQIFDLSQQDMPDIQITYRDAYGFSAYTDEELLKCGADPEKMAKTWRTVTFWALREFLLRGDLTDEARAVVDQSTPADSSADRFANRKRRRLE